MNLLNSRTWLIDSFIKSDKSIFEFIKHVYITWGVLKLAFSRFPFPYRNSFDHVVCCAQHSCYNHGKWLLQLINRNHPCEIRQYRLSLCLTPCWCLPLCCRHVVTGTFGILLPYFCGSFTSWSYHHCIAHLIDAVVSCTTTCIPR